MTVSTLNRYLRCTKAQIAFISETRCGVARAEERIQNLPLRNSIVVSSIGKSGGLWLIWGEDVNVRLIEQNKNMIVIMVREKGCVDEWMLIGVYGDPNRVENPEIWNDLESHVSGFDGSACLTGDFNAIVSSTEKWGGQVRLSSPNKAFRTWINQAGLIDLGHSGPAYTWSNKQFGSQNVSQRLDRALGNLSWTMKNPDSLVFHLPRFQSDHMPILLRTKPSKKRSKPGFKCENWWGLREDFKEVCQKSVMGSASSWNQVARNFKSEVKKWVRKIKTPDILLKECEKEMHKLNSMQPDLIQPGEEKEIQNQHERCLLMQEYYWHQRSRLNWALYGDNNTKFFHASAVTRKRRNTINALRTEQGNWVTDEKLIRATFVSHFRGIYVKGSMVDVESIYGAELLAALPKISEAAQDYLVADPSDEEIYKALMSLGANKSPGPDGFNAKTIQENWVSFGPAILTEVKGFFSSGLMSAHVARSNLILIPKVDEPTEVSHFRPISVCNVIYKVISKLICSRLKPFIGNCISQAQSAFVPGRDISDNVILLREVLHSFRSNNYHTKGFCLKVDLSKAFDRMDWDYLERIMPLYGFPSKLIMWIMGCVRSAEFSVVLNGVGDGFFKPKCGLRQGCALSPYLFILGMDLLCRSLENLALTGILRGLKLAPQAAVLTSCVYADDLLLFGDATCGEAEIIKQVLFGFSSISGQQVGPQKSSIWFSRCTPEVTRLQISQIFELNVTNIEVKYLGAPVVSAKESYDFLLQKVSSRLQTWKGRTLSHAGRVVVIKSVLQALPIYFMSTDRIPESVIRQITGLMRRFFWGAMDKDKFLAYVAWSKITRPIDQGGLGIRDLSRMNEALMMKLLWKIASGNSALWVDVVQAKYMPRSELWLVKRNYKCTPCWRAIMSARDQLLPMLTWRLGHGRTCNAMVQPWFRGAIEGPPPTAEQRRLCVRDLVIEETGTWNVNLLIQLFGHVNCMTILGSVLPPRDGAGDDTLIFANSSTGKFSVKHAYKGITQEVHVQQGSMVWKLIWRKGQILPRIRVFLWKLLHGALPLAKIISSRTSRGNPSCAVCNQGEEDTMHMLFLCPFARACWLLGSLALRTDVLPQDLTLILNNIFQQSSEEVWTDMANTSWAIWRCRNEKTYGGKVPTFERFSEIFRTVGVESRIASTPNKMKGPQCVLQVESNSVYKCKIDGSWKPPWRGGVGFVVEEGDELKGYRAAPSIVCSPIQAEAVALREALQFVKSQGLQTCTFYTDNQVLANVCSDIHPPLEADWTAYREINEIWRLLKENEFDCRHIPRSQNALADHLAKEGSSLIEGVTGFTYPILNYR